MLEHAERNAATFTVDGGLALAAYSVFSAGGHWDSPLATDKNVFFLNLA